MRWYRWVCDIGCSEMDLIMWEKREGGITFGKDRQEGVLHSANDRQT
jgi:hypothetical protein